jgi:RNase H-like domain found in reverse transcriptase
MIVYFSHFIPHFSDCAAPLFKLLCKDVQWSWGAEQESAFRDLKLGLMEAPVLGHPMAGQLYRVYFDASDIAIGASLQQVQPIKLKDLLGSKAHDKVMFTYKAGGPIPQLACQASKQIHDVPKPGSWEDKVEDTVVFVE